MKQKLKKYVEKHKPKAEPFLYGVTVGSLIGLWAVVQTERGSKLANAELYHDVKNNLDFLQVTLTNGQINNYLWKKSTE